MKRLRIADLASRWAGLLVIALLLGGCVNATVDEMTYNEPVAGIGESSVVIWQAVRATCPRSWCPSLLSLQSRARRATASATSCWNTSRPITEP